MGYLTSGNPVVDAMGSLNITGNVIPTIWYKTVLKENGKPYLLAIAILADIVYWYRPVEVRSQATGQIIGWKKKFSGDTLRQSYQYYADLFGESKRTVKSAIDRLEEIHVLRREFRTLVHGEGLVSNNVMYLELVPDQLYVLTYPEAEPCNGRGEKPCTAGTENGMGGGLPAGSGAFGVEETDGYFVDSATGMEKFGGSLLTESETSMEKTGRSLLTKSETGMEKTGRSLLTESETGMEKISRTLPTNLDPPIEKFCRRGVQNVLQALPDFATGGTGNVYTLPQKNVGVPTQYCGTNTEITSKNTYRDLKKSINPSICTEDEVGGTDRMEDADACMELIKRNIEYEHHMKYDSYDERGLYEELYAVICEVVCVRHKSIRIGGEHYPYGLVREKFLKLEEPHLRYVMECMKNTTTKIGNVKAYMVTALYNAPLTMNHYYQQEVSHDMYGGGWQG